MRTQRPTMSDVAARAGVSRTLVSFILAGKPGAGEQTRDRVLRAAEELGYRPDSAARLLARRRSRTLGVLLDVQQPFQSDLVSAIYPVAEAAGYEVLLSATAPGRDEDKAIEALLSHRCEGLVLLGPACEPTYLMSLADRAVVVVVGRPVASDRFDSVHTADAKGIRQSVDHLVELGHRRIVHVDGGTDPGSAQRRRSYQAVMRRHGLGEQIRVVPGAHTEQAGIAAAELLLGEPGPLPTAVLAGNDRAAVGLMDSMIRAGLDVPGDVSIVGFDDNQFAALSRIDLTTVRQDADAIATHAVQFAVSRLEDAALATREKVLDPHLVIRGSTDRRTSSPSLPWRPR